MSFEGKVALVTGSSRNIGLAIAEGFARGGARVVLNAAESEGELEAAAADLRSRGFDVLPALADISDPEAVTRMVDHVVDAFGGIDHLVINHAVRPIGKVLEISHEDWHWVQGVNFHGTFYLCKSVLPVMIERGGGTIVAIAGNTDTSRILGIADPKSHTLSSLAGRTTILRSVMSEYAPDGIRVNFVQPGIITTERKHLEWYSKQEGSPQRDERSLQSVPLRRPGTIDEVAAAVLWLASDDASYVNGATLAVTGGWGV
jgi:3-oxoacyl-[acyl-carrier protein] reductase